MPTVNQERASKEEEIKRLKDQVALLESKNRTLVSDKKRAAEELTELFMIPYGSISGCSEVTSADGSRKKRIKKKTSKEGKTCVLCYFV